MSSIPPAPPEQNPYGATPTGEKKAPVLSIISLILGILGVLGSGVGFLSLLGLIGVIFPIGAIVLGFLGKNREPQASKGLWMTGIITGFVGLALTLLFVVLSTILFASLSTLDPSPYL